MNSTMDVLGTAIEQYFNQLIHLRMLSQVVVSDRQGNTVLACFGPTPGGNGLGPSGASGSAMDEMEDDSMPIESNVVLSGARCFQHLDQLGLGVPGFISSQYHDAAVVQAVDGSVMLTLIGNRSQGHAVGGLIALIPQIKKAVSYQELLQKVEECYQ